VRVAEALVELVRRQHSDVLFVQELTDEAAAGLAHMLSELPETGRDEETTIAAAQAARERVLSESGVLASIP